MLAPILLKKGTRRYPGSDREWKDYDSNEDDFEERQWRTLVVIIAKSGALLPNDGDFDDRPVPENKEDAEFGVVADSSFRDEIEDSEGTNSRRLGRLGSSVPGRPAMTEVVNGI